MGGTETTRRFGRSAEGYLKLIYELGPDAEVVGVSALAVRLGVSPPSVTGMAKRLAEAGLVDRAPYRGLSLTREGREAALGVVRRHRLIELHLVEALGYPRDEVHEEAENLGHAASEGFVDRLEGLLGHPRACPHGSPIPTKGGEVAEEAGAPLVGLGVGERAVVRRVLDRDPEVLRRLAGMGLNLGTQLELVERRPPGGALVVACGGENLVVGPELAAHVFVEPAPIRGEDGASGAGTPRRPRERVAVTATERYRPRGSRSAVAP